MLFIWLIVKQFSKAICWFDAITAPNQELLDILSKTEIKHRRYERHLGKLFHIVFIFHLALPLATANASEQKNN